MWKLWCVVDGFVFECYLKRVVGVNGLYLYILLFDGSFEVVCILWYLFWIYICGIFS